MSAAAQINLGGGDGRAWVRLADPFDRVLDAGIARETLRQALDLERIKARMWIGEYAEAMKRGQRRTRRR